MTYTGYAVTAAVALSVIGMMLVIGGVLMAGLFLPGVVVIAISLVGYAAAGVLHVREGARAEPAAGQTAAD
jgi:hypothetical protein